MVTGVFTRLTPELSDHGQHQTGLAFRTTVHRCPWFAPVILLGFLGLISPKLPPRLPRCAVVRVGIRGNVADNVLPLPGDIHDDLAITTRAVLSKPLDHRLDPQAALLQKAFGER